MSTKPPADPPLERSANPVRPAAAPAPRKPVTPPPKSGFQRFVLQFLLLVIALGGAFGTGYLVNANEMQLDRSNLLQQQLDAQERILALEQQIAELQERRESGNRVELDLTEVFEPIREAVGRIALVRMGEISREITTELTRLVGDDMTSLDEPTNTTGGVAPGGMIDGTAAPGRTPEPEAASVDETTQPPAADLPNPLQPSSAALDIAEVPDHPEVVDSTDDAQTEPAAVPAASNALPADDALPGETIERPATTEEVVSQDASLDAAPDSTAEGAGIVTAEASAPQEIPVLAELESPTAPGGLPRTVP
jgi:hypothetical protein